MQKYAILLFAIALFISGCAQQGAPTDQYAGNNSSQANGNGAQAGSNGTQTSNNGVQAQTNSTQVNNMTQGDAIKNPVVVFETTKGTFKAEIYQAQAPITAGNFLSLVRSGFYNGLTFHRVEPNFVIQGGDPNGDGSGGSDKEIPLEIVNGLNHVYGTLSMARTSDPNSATSQFFVVKGPAEFLDGQYAVFGRVSSVDGMGIVEKIAVGDKMTKVYVE